MATKLLSIADIEPFFVKPTGLKGRPKLSFGATQKSPQFRIAMMVAKLAIETGNISEAQRQVAQRQHIPFQTVKTYCKRHLKHATLILAMEASIVGPHEEVRRRLINCPEEVMTRLSTMTSATLLRILRAHDIDHGPSAWLIDKVRRYRQQSDHELFIMLMDGQV